MKTSILVTGGRGLIGTRFCRLYGHKWNLLSASLKDGFDIQDRRCFQHPLVAESPKLIVHLAAFTNVSLAYQQSDDEFGSCYRVNVTGTRNMVELANRWGAHLIHISTDFVFDGGSSHPIAEDSLPNPIEWYGKTKWLAENVVRNQAENWTLARIAFPYLQEPGIRNDFIAGIKDKLVRGETLNLFADQVITPTFCDDIADAINLLAEKKPNHEVFHLAGPEFMTPYEVGLVLARHLGCLTSQVVSSSLSDYLKKDPRPRQRILKMDSAKYREFSLEYGSSPFRRLEDVFPPVAG